MQPKPRHGNSSQAPETGRARLRPSHRQAGAERYQRPGARGTCPPSTPWRPRPDRVTGPALIDGRTRLDAAGVEAGVAGLAAGLLARGVGPGDVVAWQLPNVVEAYLLYRACWRLGAIAAPLHHQAGAADVAKMLAQVNPVVAVSDPQLPLAGVPGTVTVDEASPDWRALAGGGGGPGSGEARGQGEGVAAGRGVVRGEDLAVVLFTSGSTGEAKAVLHAHRGLAHKALSSVRAHGLGSGDAVLMPAPLAHISGLLNGVLVPLAAGMTSVLMERWDPGRALDLVERERISFMIGPPALFTSMRRLDGFSAERVASMRVISCGSMGITPEFIDETRAAFDATTKRTYGSTEAPTVTTSAWSDPPDRARDRDGRPMGQAELRIVDPESGHDLPAGEAGELWVRGPELFVGYADARQTDEAMHDDWFRTGDLATLDDAGWLTIVGRLKELIIRGGENVVPFEVERVLERHPSVRQAVVVGYPDDVLGERVAAFLITDGPFDLEECRRWFAQQGAARFKTPERVYVVSELPLISLGKPDRAALRARCCIPPA